MSNSDSLPIVAEYYPSIPREEIELKCKTKLSIKDVSNLGSGFAVMATEVLDAVKATKTNEGLYRCVFPEGVTGKLAKFNNEDAFLGTIMNENGFAGQARWIPAEGQSLMMAIDPVTIAVAAAMMDINKKLDAIQEAEKEIFDFMSQDKESKIEGGINSLANIYEGYSYNTDNSTWKISQLTTVSGIKKEAENNIIFYRKQIQSALKKQKAIHSTQDADKLLDKMQHRFKYYNASVYLHSYASFVEVILGDNYKEDYLQYVSEKIKSNIYQYMVDYTRCYDQLNDYVGSSAQKKMLEGIGTVSKATGHAVSKVPLLNKGILDDALINAGKKLTKINEKNIRNDLSDFRDNRLIGTQIFLDNIDAINETCNKKVELLFDDNVIYICS